jgi:hypothetical protein
MDDDRRFFPQNTQLPRRNLYSRRTAGDGRFSSKKNPRDDDPKGSRHLDLPVALEAHRAGTSRGKGPGQRDLFRIARSPATTTPFVSNGVFSKVLAHISCVASRPGPGLAPRAPADDSPPVASFVSRSPNQTSTALVPWLGDLGTVQEWVRVSSQFIATPSNSVSVLDPVRSGRWGCQGKRKAEAVSCVGACQPSNCRATHTACNPRGRRRER